MLEWDLTSDLSVGRVSVHSRDRSHEAVANTDEPSLLHIGGKTSCVKININMQMRGVSVCHYDIIIFLLRHSC